jgi:L-2-hydroxyglutarate oxidase LhgO
VATTWSVVLVHVQGKMAIHSPHTGIVDWGLVARSFGEDFKANGGKIITGFKVSVLLVTSYFYDTLIYY